jgi:hypothetical protein
MRARVLVEKLVEAARPDRCVVAAKDRGVGRVFAQVRGAFRIHEGVRIPSWLARDVEI